jgi:hypothetical protein
MIVYKPVYKPCKAAFAQLATHLGQDPFTIPPLARVPSPAAIMVRRRRTSALARAGGVKAGDRPDCKITSPRDTWSRAGRPNVISRGRVAVRGTCPGEAVRVR